MTASDRIVERSFGFVGGVHAIHGATGDLEEDRVAAVEEVVERSNGEPRLPGEPAHGQAIHAVTHDDAASCLDDPVAALGAAVSPKVYGWGAHVSHRGSRRRRRVRK